MPLCSSLLHRHNPADIRGRILGAASLRHFYRCSSLQLELHYLTRRRKSTHCYPPALFQTNPSHGKCAGP